MFAIISGILLIGFTVVACLPSCLNWGTDIISFLKGAAPVASAFIGLIAFFIGYADIKDKKEAKKEELARQAEEQASKKAD
ncbi:MAG: hypothetical protein K6G80_07585 [Treponema sp.]|nr:hypothetical protein [Treponema sp.]